jgi:phosphinothricin acetyltransferase
MPLIRPARPDDASAITDIYNAGIADRGATFETAPRTVAEIQPRLDESERYPIVVAEDGMGRVAGWAGVSGYRTRACYAGVGEFSVYVARESRGQGLGRALLGALVDAARDAGYWKLVSRVFPFNAASRAACRAAGFREAGVYEKHGFLDGRWQDVVIVERLIPENQAPGGLRFRRARAADWPVIESLLSDAKLPLDGARDHLAGFVVAVRGETVVGCAALERMGDPDVLLRSVALAPGERGSGAGRALVTRTINQAARAGARSVVLLTTTAEAFFAHLGFTRIDRAGVPASLLGSAEFTGACPSTAAIMRAAVDMESRGLWTPGSTNQS